MREDKKNVYVGSDTEGGITSGYAMNDGVELKVPYSFFGSIYDEEEEKAVLAAMKQESQTMGPQVQMFQKEFAKLHNVKHAFATANCTTAMHIVTQVFDLREGDEVIITPNTFIATTLVLLKEKVKPVYADIDPRTFNIDPSRIEEKITPRTKAIYVVHYGGQMCDMDPIMDIAKRHNLFVMEDCAHAVGAEYKGKKAGSIGDIGCFSFHSLKNITTLGEGGMITTNRDDFVDAIDKLRCMSIGQWQAKQKEFKFGEHTLTKTSEGKYTDYWIPSHFDVVSTKGHFGNNYRMTECQAACGRAQLRKVDMLTGKRRENSHYLSQGLKGIKGVTTPYEDENCFHVCHLYTLCVEEEKLGAGRDEFMRVLYKEEGIQGILHYQPNYDFTCMKKLGYDKERCLEADKFFYKRELNLPMHPRLTKKELDMIIKGVKNAAEKVLKI